ncbi:MAG: AI-2E family transporter, partial [Candidatus Gracilibacteria bacterium]|nr:AI-2E family transporter [Candidatus Gracilibacteria bacterium]
MAFSEKKSHLFAGIILLIFSLIALYLGYLVFSGVFIPLLLAILFAVVFYPVYNWLLQKTKSEIWSSLLTSLMLIAIIAAFVSFVIYLAVGEVVNIARLFTRSIDIQSMTFLTDQEQLEGLVQETIHSLDTFVQQIPFVDTSITAVLGQLLENIPPLIQEISSYIISIIRVGFDG